MTGIHEKQMLTQRCFPPPKFFRVLVGGQIIGIECDILRLQDAQDVFYTTSDQRVGTARWGGSFDTP